MSSSKVKSLKPAKWTTESPFVDTHCHLDYVVDFAGQPVSSIPSLFSSREIFGRGLVGVVNVAILPDHLEPCEQIAKENPGIVRTAWGVHPHQAKDWKEPMARQIAELVSKTESVAWGEIGLDYHYDHSPRDVQRDVFSKQLSLAVAVGKPLVIHSREADDDTHEIMKKIVPDGYPVHLHCFTANWAFADRMLKSFPGLRIGLTGCCTFKNAKHLQEVAKNIPFDRLLLETDGPFMAPDGCRGDIAHPGHVPMVAKAIAGFRGTTVDEVMSRCLANTRSLYGFP